MSAASAALLLLQTFFSWLEFSLCRHLLTALCTFSFPVAHVFLSVFLLLLLYQRSSLAAVLECRSTLWWPLLTLAALDHTYLLCSNISIHRRVVTITSNYDCIFLLSWRKKKNHCTINVMLQCFPDETFSSFKAFFKDFLWFHFRLTNSKWIKILNFCSLFNSFVLS